MSILAHWLTLLAQPFGLDGPARMALGAGLAGLGLAGLLAVFMWRVRRKTRVARHGATEVRRRPDAASSARVPEAAAEPLSGAAAAAGTPPLSVSRPLTTTLTEVVARPTRTTVPSRPILVARGETSGDLPPGGVAVAERPRREPLDLRDLIQVDGAREGLDLFDPLVPPAPGFLTPDERPAVAGDAAAREQYQRGLALLAGAGGETAVALDEALACFRRAQAIWTREAAPERWATVENDIGWVYLLLPGADRAAHVRAAIEHHHAALEIFDPVHHALYWAWTQSALGVAYQIRPVDSALANARAAVAYHKRALDVFTRENAPRAWAWNKNNLGAAYETMRGGAAGEWVASLRAAAECYEDALDVYTRDAYPLHHQIVARNLERVRAELSLLD